MGCQITIQAGTAQVKARLFDTPTALKTAAALPITATASTWGDEIYFSIPVEEPLDESAQEIVKEGDIGFWPPGQAFCLFFGKTPISTGTGIKPASAVNMVGMLEGSWDALKLVQEGDPVIIEKA
jgi:hypothetical protein